MTYALRLNCLNKQIDGHTLLKEVTMRIREGEIYGLLGANGAGKTTLMKSIFQMLLPDSGEVLLWDKRITRDCNSSFAQIGSIIEAPVFYESFDGRKNLRLHASYMGSGHERIEEMLSLFDLAAAGNKPVRYYSLGMKQRLALARALLSGPRLLILDEPMNGLDPQGITALRELLLKINQEEKTTILLSSHILNELEKTADTVGIIDKGSLLAEIRMDELRNKRVSLEDYYLGLLKEVG